MGLIYFIGGLIVIVMILFAYLEWVGRVKAPNVSNAQLLSEERQEPSPGFYTFGNNWFRKSRSGLYELYVEGEPYERGVANGKMTRELVQLQEDYFNEQIDKMIPSKSYRHFLKYFVGWFNRNLDKNVKQEFKEEIYGVSASASDKYAYIGSRYQRLLNYHAAHDIGHALQNLALVGCTSFGTWNDRSDSGHLIIGRNFDFYAGDKFAENKIVAFMNPSHGYKFMSITWAGFVGVVSGMNEKGLTVTINAAKSGVPTGSATPVSLVAREILQYARNISEAMEIARKRKMFVSESFLIGSREDHKAVIIEKTPHALEVYDPGQDYIVCANHFQSEGLGKSRSNREQIKESASAYRQQRLLELLNGNGKNTVQKTVDILRDRLGLQGADIGLGNEKAINQLIAHHSIVFDPDRLMLWVSTTPWQLGGYVAYDLNKIFSLKGMKTDHEICDPGNSVAADPFATTPAFRHFLAFRKMKQAMSEGENICPDSLVASNPSYYHAYALAGDYEFKKKEYRKAMGYYRQAQTKLIATKKEEEYIQHQIEKCLNR